MTIYADTIGNKFLGDCIYANHNIGYPTLNFLKADQLNNFSANLASLLTAAGLPFRNIIPQTDISSFLGGAILTKSIVHFGGNGDINDRYGFAVNWNNVASTGSGGPVTLFNNNGSANVTNSMNESTNLLARADISANFYGVAGGMQSLRWDTAEPNITHSPVYVMGVADSQSCGLLFYQRLFTSNRVLYWFVYAGVLADVNTNNNYYDASIVSSSFILAGGQVTNIDGRFIQPLGGRHYISNTAKLPLETGDAQYPIVCSDGQNPTATWATDFYVFDNNPNLGFPVMGRVRNLLLAQGSYTIGKPVRISPSVYPDAGFNAWLPVGTFAGKTVLMRCYSSVDL